MVMGWEMRDMEWGFFVVVGFVGLVVVGRLRLSVFIHFLIVEGIYWG